MLFQGLGGPRIIRANMRDWLKCVHWTSSNTIPSEFLVGVDWKRVLPAWLRVLAATAVPAEFVQRAEPTIRHHCHGEQSEMLVLVSSVEMSLQHSAARDPVR